MIPGFNALQSSPPLRKPLCLINSTVACVSKASKSRATTFKDGFGETVQNDCPPTCTGCVGRSSRTCGDDNAFPDFDSNVLYLDVKRGDYNRQYQCKVIHHEFFHLIDFQDDGEIYTDHQWLALNTKQFRYGSGGREAQSMASTSVLTDRYPGFLNHYSTTGVEEDKAEMFANLIVVPKYMEKRTLDDGVIQSKVNAIKSLLKEFCPDMDSQFWARLIAVHRSEK